MAVHANNRPYTSNAAGNMTLHEGSARSYQQIRHNALLDHAVGKDHLSVGGHLSAGRVCASDIHNAARPATHILHEVNLTQIA
jgi:hypothetical protein